MNSFIFLAFQIQIQRYQNGAFRHRRWTTTPPLLIPRFNSRDTLSLSSVKVIRYLQLNSLPRVYILDRPSGEPPEGINWMSLLSRPLKTADAAISSLCCRRMNERRMVPFLIFNIFMTLDHLLVCLVQLGTYLSCSTIESHVMMYHDP
jgi:hypothetical protein